MNIYLLILAELFFCIGLILFLYHMKSRLGLIPLYVFIGASQYLQTVLSTSFHIPLFGGLNFTPGSSFLFSASMFSILLIYIKEGLKTTQQFIYAIVIANFSITLINVFTNFQELAINGVVSEIFKLNFRIFLIGTLTLILDAFLLVIIYEYFFARVKWLNLYSRLLVSLLIILNFDAIVFIMGIHWGHPEMWTKILSQMTGKSIASVFFASAFFVYLRFFDKVNIKEFDKVSKGSEDIFSILTYQGKFEKLKIEKAISEEELQKIISKKTNELEKSIRRFTILSSMHELRIDKFSSSEQASEILKKVQLAFEADACSIHLIKKDKLKLLAGIGMPNEKMEKSLPLTFPYLNEIIRKKKTQAIVNTGNGPHFMSILNDPENTLWYNSCAGSPLLAGDKVIGIIMLYSLQKERIFTALELEHLQMVANQIGYTLENAKLFEQNEKHKEILVKQIIARKIVDDAIKESEEKYRTLVQQAADGIFIVDLEGNYLVANESASKITGYSIDELKKMNGRDIVDKEDLNKNPLKVEELKTRKSVFIERVIRRKDQSRIYVEISAKLMDNGKVITIMRDVTLRKKAEEEIRENEEIFQRLFNESNDPILLLDETGFYDCNQSAVSILGYATREDLIHKKPWELSPEKQPDGRLSSEKAAAMIKKALQQGYNRFEWIHTKSDGKEFPVEVMLTPIIIKRKQTYYTVWRDISERKKAEEKINVYTDQLKQLTGHLLNIREDERKRIGREIHDDLGQQLTAIKMDIAWIDKKTPEDAVIFKEKLKSVIMLLDESNQSVRRILSELRPSILDDYGLMDALNWHAKSFTDNTGIPLEIISSKEDFTLPEPVATCIFRIFQESLTNITRYAKAKKVITTLNIHAHNIEVSIEDDGIGFDKNELKTRRSFGIMGMKERVSSLEGKFEIVSGKGEGTRVSINIPY